MSKFKFKLPNTLVLIYSFVVLMAILTWIIPSGEFNRELLNGKEIIIDGSFHYVKSNPQFIIEILMAPITGFLKTADIIIFLLIVGGAFGVLKKTEAIDAAIFEITKAHNKYPFLKKFLIPILMIIFSLAGAVFGMSEETIPFILIFVPLAIMLGYDTITGVAIPFLGAGAGFAGAFINPFTLGIAQTISDLPPLSGMEYRIVCWIVLTTAAIIFTVKHANKVKKNPALSPTPEIDKFWKENLHLSEIENKFQKLSKKHLMVLSIFGLSMALLVFGVLEYKWYINELSALFLGTGIVVGIFGSLNIQELTDSFLDGAKELFSTALIVAFARAILVVAADGKIIDTILFSLSSMISELHPILSSWAMFIIQSILNFFIPSGSGKAALTMPIMAPLSDLIGVARQTTVLAYQFGDGFTNLIIPTSPVTMAILALSKIPYEKWAKWMLPMQIIFFILGLLLLIPPLLIGWK